MRLRDRDRDEQPGRPHQGFILSQEIKRLNPNLADRILFISGILFGQSTVDHLGSIGAGFLSKPFQIESLIEAVDKIANRRPN